MRIKLFIIVHCNIMKLELILYEFKVMNHEGVEGLSLNFLAI
jgi:hypothetical protein